MSVAWLCLSLAQTSRERHEHYKALVCAYDAYDARTQSFTRYRQGLPR